MSKFCQLTNKENIMEAHEEGRWGDVYNPVAWVLIMSSAIHCDTGQVIPSFWSSSLFCKMDIKATLTL